MSPPEPVKPRKKDNKKNNKKNRRRRNKLFGALIDWWYAEPEEPTQEEIDKER